METKIVRLSSGEEVICKTETVEREGTSFVKIKNPAILVPVGEGQLAFAPWLLYADIKDGLEIEAKFIVFIVPPQLELSNQYNETIGSGIVVPTQSTSDQPLFQISGSK